MRPIYDAIFLLVLLITSPVWGWRLLRTGKWRTDWPARFGKADPRADGRPCILIHAVSVGEVNAIRHLVAHLERMAQGKARIVISTTTDTGTARARELFEPRLQVVRYPFDVTFAVRRFLDAVRPDVVLLTELEVWPNFTRHCKERGVRIGVVNGRLSARSFSRYKIIRPLIAPSFRRLDYVMAQTRDYADRFIQLGTAPDRVEVADTMKWDTAQIADHVSGSDELARALGIDPARRVIVAGSTGPGEDKLLADACPPDAQLILVPRKPEWFDDAARAMPGVVRRTQHPDGTHRTPDPTTRFFLLDTMGELRKAYALADVVVVGRSFLGLHGSDMMEPVALGKPTLVGPFHSDFQETVDALTKAQGLIVTDNPGAAIRDLLADPQKARALADAGREVVRSRQGASEKNAQVGFKLLHQA